MRMDQKLISTNVLFRFIPLNCSVAPGRETQPCKKRISRTVSVTQQVAGNSAVVTYVILFLHSQQGD